MSSAPLRMFCLVSVLLLAACSSRPETKSYYFTSPRQAVTTITKLLKAKDWPTLARYYRLDDAKTDRATLESGEFFYTDKRPEGAGQGGLWRYKRPFSPGYKYLESRDLKTLGQVEVTVMIEIDQGGGMVQRGLRSFLMFRTPDGYQLLTDEAPTR